MIIYIGNLSLDTTEEELETLFVGFGDVVSVTIMNDKYIGSGQPRAYGYICMDCKSEGASAIAGLEGQTLNDRNIVVVEARQLSDDRTAAIKMPRFSRSVRTRQRND